MNLTKMMFIVAVVLLFFLPISSANPAFFYRIDQETPISFSCLDEDYFYCNSTTTCNITIFYPNQTVFVNNRLMTRQDSFYNYSITPNARGVYTVSAHCFSTAENGFSTFSFGVTETGAEQRSRIDVVIIASVVILVLVILSIVALLMGLRHKGGEDETGA